MTWKEIIEMMQKENSEALTLDGLDEAICGIARRCSSKTVFIYDRSKIIDILSEDMTIEDAEEYISFNIEGAWMGESTPYIMETVSE